MTLSCTKYDVWYMFLGYLWLRNLVLIQILCIFNNKKSADDLLPRFRCLFQFPLYMVIKHSKLEQAYTTKSHHKRLILSSRYIDWTFFFVNISESYDLIEVFAPICWLSKAEISHFHTAFIQHIDDRKWACRQNAGNCGRVSRNV